MEALINVHININSSQAPAELRHVSFIIKSGINDLHKNQPLVNATEAPISAFSFSLCVFKGPKWE